MGGGGGWHGHPMGGHMGGGWHGGGHRGWGGGWGPAVGLGILGLGALGAAGAYEYGEPGYSYGARCPAGYYFASNGVCYPY